MSANQLGTFMVETSIARKQAIVRQAKNPPKVMVLRDRHTKKAVSDCLRYQNTDFVYKQQTLLQDQIDEVSDLLNYASSEEQENKIIQERRAARRGVEMLNRFIAMYNRGDFENLSFSAGKRTQKNISGVRVSVTIDLQVVSLLHQGTGGAVLRFASTMPDGLMTSASIRVAAVIQAALRSGSDMFDTVSHDLCMALNIPNHDVIRSPKDLSDFLTEAEDACQLFAEWWDITDP